MSPSCCHSTIKSWNHLLTHLHLSKACAFTSLQAISQFRRGTLNSWLPHLYHLPSLHFTISRISPLFFCLYSPLTMCQPCTTINQHVKMLYPHKNSERQLLFLSMLQIKENYRLVQWQKRCLILPPEQRCSGTLELELAFWLELRVRLEHRCWDCCCAVILMSARWHYKKML